MTSCAPELQTNALEHVVLPARQDLLGHKSGRMTTHYSAAEVGNLLPGFGESDVLQSP
jgi:hypothetical protein